MLMNDPPVARLRYRLVTRERFSFNSPAPVHFSHPSCDFALDDGLLTVKMKEHHASAGSAIESIRPLLRAWEIETALTYGPDAMRFEYSSCEMVDRMPSPDTPRNPVIMATLNCATGGTAIVSQMLGRYPVPPTSFKVTPLVELLWSRYRQYQQGRDLLTTMGYTCLSAVQSQARSRANASVQYSIERAVLDKLGELTSDMGDELTARKFDECSTRQAHTAAEKEWIVKAVKLLIRRVAEYEHDPSATLRQLTMADLPAL
jgi:hypothetical protein